VSHLAPSFSVSLHNSVLFHKPAGRKCQSKNKISGAKGVKKASGSKVLGGDRENARDDGLLHDINTFL
jgi:hypothetical protein